VASFPSAGSTLMPVAVATFRRGHPDVALTLAEGEPEEIAPRLRANEFDLALLFEFPGVRERPGAGLRTVTLLEDPMHVALPADHPLASKRALRLADLRGEDWVQTSAPSPCARHVVRLCLAAGFEPNVTFESDDYETVQGLVASGVGVALVPRLALSHVHPGIVVRELSPRSPARKVVAATMSKPGVAPAARTMIKILDDVAREYVHAG
jgi:DNA-binding transcriptional LysR family regulator